MFSVARISRIRIEQQMAEIGVNSTKAQMKITRPKMQMRITNEMPQMELNTEAPTFKVNRRKINSESGLKPPKEFSNDNRDEGKRGALKGTKTAVEDGNFLGETRIPGDRVAKLARSKAMSAMKESRQINIGLMPNSPAEITWDKGQMRVNWSKHSLVIDWDGDYMPQVTLEPPHSVEVYLRTKPYFRILVEEGDPPIYSGVQFDQAI